MYIWRGYEIKYNNYGFESGTGFDTIINDSNPSDILKSLSLYKIIIKKNKDEKYNNRHTFFSYNSTLVI